MAGVRDRDAPRTASERAPQMPLGARDVLRSLIALLDAVEHRAHVNDLHATILHLMGLDHERLTFKHAGRDFRLTDVHGQVVKAVIA